MSARKDYPPFVGAHRHNEQGKYDAMCDEIDRLRLWKDEAIIVIEEWEKCCSVLEASGFQPPLGAFNYYFVKEWIVKRLPWQASG